jgi:DNA repair protein SbcD/Mre11
MASYRFIHASDLHLDSQFGVLSADFPQLAEILRKSTFDAYKHIVDMCITEKVDALLIAGDVFDSADNSLSAQWKFNDGLTELSEHGVKSFVCHGNHDPLDGWQAGLEWPEGAFQFGPDPQSIPFSESDPYSPIVTGISYPTQEVRKNLVQEFPDPISGRPSIGLIHANVGADTGHENYAPCTVDDLVASGYDYWALGHVHTRRVLRSPDEGSPVVVYPGNSQGRHRNEPGPKGIYLVEIDSLGGITSLEFRETDVLRWQTLECSIDELNNETELLVSLENQVRNAIDKTNNRHLIYQVILSGSGPLHATLKRIGAVDEFQDRLNALFAGQNPFAVCEKFVDSSSPNYDRDELTAGTDFIADLLTLVDQVHTDPERMMSLVADAGLNELFENGRARRYLKDSSPSESLLAELTSEAERLLLHSLIEEEEELR